MKRWLFQNIGLKLLSVLIAFALWAYVGSRQVLEQRVSLHLEFIDMPSGMTLDPSVRANIYVTLVGRKDRVLEIDPQELHAVVSLKNAQNGQKEVTVHPHIQPIPPGVSVNTPDITLKLISMTDGPKKHKRSSN